METKNCLLVFTKNLIPGTVKTRIGKEKGDEVASEIYEKLLIFTRDLASKVDCNRIVYFNHHIEEDGIWENDTFEKSLQAIGHLGMKMTAAFEDAFKRFNRVIIIGSDCAELDNETITSAFDSLEEHDVVIGPAEDGGYYLIGMNKFYPFLFEDMPWSQEKLFQATLKSLKEHKLSANILDVKSDIDYWSDWEKLGW